MHSLHEGIWVELTSNGRWYVTMNARRVLEIRGNMHLRDLNDAEYDPDAPKRQPDSRVGKLIRKGAKPELVVYTNDSSATIELTAENGITNNHGIPFSSIADKIRPHLKPCPTPSG